MEFLVEFARLGRTRAPEPIKVAVAAGEDIGTEIVEAVYRYARKHLNSKDYVVNAVVLPDGVGGTGGIDAGRFGTFTFVRSGS